MKLLASMSFVFLLCAEMSSAGWGFGDSDPGSKVLAKEVSVLTLYDGKMTTGRRSSAVPQLACVGGSAQGKLDPKSSSVTIGDGTDRTYR